MNGVAIVGIIGLGALIVKNSKRAPLHTPATPAPTSTQPVPSGNPAGLPFLFPVTSQTYLTAVNPLAQSSDMVILESTQASLLGSIAHARRGIVWKSAAAAEAVMPGLAGNIQIAAYDPEHWAATPASEQSNLVGTVQSFAAMAHSLGMLAVVIPDDRFAQQYGAQLAPYVDVLVLQGQHYQLDKGQFAGFIQPLVTAIKQANRNCLVYSQVETSNGTPQQMADAIGGVAGIIDGVGCWIGGPTAVSDLGAFVRLMRGG